MHYTSRFDEWHDRSSVRRRPQREFAPGDNEILFPPELYPLVDHPAVTELGPEAARRLLSLRLQEYLHFTTELESISVMPVAIAIARRKSGLELPPRMCQDAFKIVTDEAFHAQSAHDFIVQIQRKSGITGTLATPPAFLRRLDETRMAMPRPVRDLHPMLCAIVSETLITALLSGLPQDERLPRSVRAVVRDHAEDEGRHHVYFRTLLDHLWWALSPTERRLAGPHIPALIDAFLAPDVPLAEQHLHQLGLPHHRAAHAVAESLCSSARNDRTDAALATVRYFADQGAMNDAETAAAFESAGYRWA